MNQTSPEPELWMKIAGVGVAIAVVALIVVGFGWVRHLLFFSM